MNAFTRFAELWTDYLEGELDEAGWQELSALLAADPELLERATDFYQTHRLLGLWGGWQSGQPDPFIADTLDRLPEGTDRFTQEVLERLKRGQVCRPTPCPPASDGERLRRQLPQHWGLAGWLVALLCLLALPIVAHWETRTSPSVALRVEPQNADRQEQPPADPLVRFASLAHATFFGQLNPRTQEPLALGQDYVLTAGLVELAFPQGAQAIIEGPAVFRVVSADCLSMDLGRCSVHAPEGAEGFRVETPVTQVVDRGTRFLIQVTETNETEVQVLEGIADIYQLPQESPSTPAATSPSEVLIGKKEPAPVVRLVDRQARRILNERQFVAEPTPFDAERYRRQLPDRLISYEATPAENGAVDRLLGVTVQRGGQVVRYAAEELIPVEIISFRADEGIDKNGHVLGGAELPDSRIETLSDFYLNTGIINPGGSPLPLTEDPVMHVDQELAALNTPGMGLRFARPVKNGPGPDIVLFEVHPISGPGHDAFHVSPLHFKGRRKSHTIQHYDLSLTTPEALKVPDFYLYPYEQTVTSLAQLQSLPVQRRHIPLSFRAVAVGIDLSDLGFEPGEEAEGIFLQDAMDDQNRVDPVFIGGLP